MPYLVPREVVELLLHRHHPIRILKCFLYPVWLNRGNKRVMLTKMCNTRSSGYPFMNVAEDGVDGVISLYCLVDSGVAALVLHPPCLHHLHLPLDHCRHLEEAHHFVLPLYQLEPRPHFGLVEMLAWRRM